MLVEHAAAVAARPRAVLVLNDAEVPGHRVSLRDGIPVPAVPKVPTRGSPPTEPHPN
jgi:hypothetical protein